MNRILDTTPHTQGAPLRAQKPHVELDRHLLTQYAGFLLSQSGLHFTQSNMSDLAHGIRMTMDATGVDSAARLLAELTTSGEHAKRLFDTLARNVTIGETYFLRYPEQFLVLQNEILPDLIHERRRAKDLYLRLWSAGCSSGEEAYSLAILLRDLLPDFDQWHIQILATDINRDSLARAASGDYSAWSFRGVPDDIIQRHFIPHKDNGKILSVHPQLKKAVRIEYLNLGDDCYPSLLTQTTAMDFVFCRNVLIYFNEKSAAHVIDRLFSSLVEGGSLMVGPVEPNETLFRKFESRFTGGTMIYRRKKEVLDEAPAPAVKPAPPKSLHSKTPVQTTAPKALPKLGFLPRKKDTATDNDPMAFIQLAQSAWKDGHIERAKQHARRAVELDARVGEGHFLLALIDADRAHFESAELHIEKAIRMSPLDVRVHHLASIIASERGLTEHAVTHLKKCVFLDRHFVLGHFGLAVALRELKNSVESARYLKNVLSLLENVADDATLPGVDDIAAGWLKKVSTKYLRDIENTRSK